MEKTCSSCVHVCYDSLFIGYCGNKDSCKYRNIVVDDYTNCQGCECYSDGKVGKGCFARQKYGGFYYVIDSLHNSVALRHETNHLIDEENYDNANYCTDSHILNERLRFENLYRQLWRFYQENSKGREGRVPVIIKNNKWCNKPVVISILYDVSDSKNFLDPLYDREATEYIYTLYGILWT